jgi:hypothetical protein
MKAMEGAKILEMQPRRILRRKRGRNVETVYEATRETSQGRGDTGCVRTGIRPAS